MSGEPYIELSAEQRAAVERPENLIVRAGAGSGKTEVLARRCVALMADDLGDGAPLDPSSIAAITFTEKAALDMRTRIATVLAQRTAVESDAERRTHLRRAARTLGLARISTIHAFCARILRENAIAADLDPDFEVLDEYESAIFAERVCREVLVKAVGARDAAALALVRARRMDDDTPREDALEIMQRMLVEARRRGQSPERIVELTEARAQRLAGGEDRVAACAKKLVELVDALVRMTGVTGKAAEAREQLARLWLDARPQVRALSRSADPRSVEVLREILEALPTAQSKTLKDTVKAIGEIVTAGSANYGLAGALISAWGEYRAAAPAAGLARLIAKAGAAIAEAQRVNRVVTFDDLLITTRDLLRCDREVADRYRLELRAILVDEYQDTNAPQDEIVALLTDPSAEADFGKPGSRQQPPPDARDARVALPLVRGRNEDTDHSLEQPVSETSTEATIDPPRLFIVGDEKQSIYRFRGADVRVFNRRRASASIELPLAENRRSTPNILNFVNGVAALAMGSQTAADYRIAWRPEHRLRPIRAVAADYPVEYIVEIPEQNGAGSAATKLNSIEKRELEGRALANLIKRIVADGEPIIDRASGAARPTEYRDFAILLRAFPDIAIYENALAAAGIPAYTVKGRGFYGRREVIDLVNLLAAIDDPRDSLALATTLRSPCFGLSDDCLMEIGLYLHASGAADGGRSIAELFARGDFSSLKNERREAEAAARVLRELRSLRDREPLQALVERALELTDYESVMAGLPQGDQQIANLRKLVELARTFDTHRFFTFHDFVAYLRRLIKEEPYEPQAQIPGETDNVVRLMTVHQAKGLEFPIVIIADAGRKPNQDNRSPQLDPENGLLLAVTDRSGYDEIPNAALEAYKARVKDEEEAEATRILYVALTRGRDRLIVSEGANHLGWVKHLRSFIGPREIDHFTRSGAATHAIERDGAGIVLRQPDPDRDLETTVQSAIAPPAKRPETANPHLTLAMLASPSPWSGGGVKTQTHEIERGEQIISPTALADLDRCPRQYWLRHGLGLPEPRYGKRGEGGDAIAMGSVAHAVLEHLHFALDARHSSATIARLVEKMGARAGLTPDQCAMIARDLARYVGSLSGSETVIGREVPFMLNAAPGLFVRGQIDVVLRAGESLIVRDYKYTRAAEARRYRVQLECYVLAIAEGFPGITIRAEIAALRENPAIRAIALPEPSEIRERLAELGEKLVAAAHAREYPKSPVNAAACRELECGYVRHCWGD